MWNVYFIAMKIYSPICVIIGEIVSHMNNKLMKPKLQALNIIKHVSEKVFIFYFCELKKAAAAVRNCKA